LARQALQQPSSKSSSGFILCVPLILCFESEKQMFFSNTWQVEFFDDAVATPSKQTIASRRILLDTSDSGKSAVPRRIELGPW
jgi:hypothetical protein